MNPSNQSPLWNEIQRLRRDLNDLSDRHHAEFMRISIRIADLESQLGKAEAHTAATPPPLPKEEPMEKAVLMPSLAAARLKVAPEKSEPSPSLLFPGPPSPIAPAPLSSSPAPSIPPSPAPLPPAPDNSFELDFGKVWFVRIGIVILLTGLVFLGNYAYQNWIREMSNGTRLAALFGCALALVETGRRLAAKENLRRFGEVLLAGGMAFFYYCTFAAHHVGRLKVIESPALAGVLLFGAAGAIAAVSWLRQAKATAVLGIVLASYSTMLQPIGWMSCFSNILLGAMGLFLMLKPGWNGPGWASMLGSYGAFFGWQLMGASGNSIRTEDPASLWFLPPLWVMFAIPGTLGRFRESLSDRARAWFTGANNALFFMLFSGIWIARNGDENYWLVPAVFGSALIALGILGRRQGATAGGVNIAQGLGVATFALILKLDGHHLALVLAFESLSLAMAAWKYRGKSEVVFSLLAGLGGFFLIGENAFSISQAAPIPVWSGFLAAALLAAASFVTTRITIAGKMITPFLRASSGLHFTAAALIAGYLCLFRLGEIPALATALFLTASLAAIALRLDPKRLWPELMWGAVGFLGIASWVGFADDKALQLTLAIECLALALVSWRFRSRTEMAFSFVAGLLAAGFALESGAPGGVELPVWTAALLSALLASASVLTIRVELADDVFIRFTRLSAAVQFVAATAVTSQLCMIRLETITALLTAATLSAILSYAYLKLDQKRPQLEIVGASLWFLGLAVVLPLARGFNELAMWPLFVAAGLSLLGGWFWQHHSKDERELHNPAAYPGFGAYAFAFAVPYFLWLICGKTAGGFLLIPNDVSLALGLNQLSALLLVPIALAMRCPRLVRTAGVYSCYSLGYLIVLPSGNAPMIFGASLLALASASAVLSPWGKRVVGEDLLVSSSIFRLSAFTSYCSAWHAFAPGSWTDFLALTSIALTIVSVAMKRKMSVECLGFIAIALLGLIFDMFTSPWWRIAGADTWRGILVVAAMLALIFTYRQRPALIADPQIRKSAIAALAGTTCLVATLWATQMLVWRFGWKPTAVLWTIFGFAFVSAGLWQRLHILRVCGFGLLIISFCKLFAMDVWDFTTFMRVASFIVLGAALILLGLFYNKFSGAIKALLDDEREPRGKG